MLVQYVKAYFNSSTSARIQDHTRRCPDPTVAKGICQIPDQLGAPTIGNVPFFYTDPSGNMTNNQSIYAVKASSGATMLTPGWGAMFFTVGIVGSMLVWGI